MNREDATTLATKFAATWHGGPKAEIWAEELEELHTNQAHDAYRRLRRSEERSPSIASFVAVYNSLTVADDSKTECPACDGGGFVEQLPIVHHRQCAGDDRCHCSAVKPCHCPVGKAREAAFNRIIGTKGNPAA